MTGYIVTSVVSPQRHQAEGRLTAYEQVSFPPGRKRADYCLPCQLVAARAARLLQ